MYIYLLYIRKCGTCATHSAPKSIRLFPPKTGYLGNYFRLAERTGRSGHLLGVLNKYILIYVLHRETKRHYKWPKSHAVMA